jgi:hypothetical protein
LAPVIGADQRGAAGYPLEMPLTVLVADETGRPMARQTVTFAVMAGGGTVYPVSVVTGANGHAATQWTLGTRLDTTQVVVATAGAGIRAEFTAESFVPVNVQTGPISGGGQTGVVGTEVAEPLVIVARTRDGRPLRGVKVDWSSEGGALTPLAERTDEQGLARARWLLPTVTGTKVATARLEGWWGVAATFHSTALSGPPARGEIVNGHARTDTVCRPCAGRWARWWGRSGCRPRFPASRPSPSRRRRRSAPSRASRSTSGTSPSSTVPPFTLTASAYDAFGNRYPAGPELTSRLYWLSPDIHILSSSDSRSGVFNTPGYGRARVMAAATYGPAADTVFVNVVP